METKKRLGEMQWDEEKDKIRESLMEIYDPKDSDEDMIRKLEDTIEKIMGDKYILDKRIDVWEKVEGQSSMFRLEEFRLQLLNLYKEWQNDGFDLRNIKEFMEVELEGINNQCNNKDS